jgi:hypothetical protein
VLSKNLSKNPIFAKLNLFIMGLLGPTNRISVQMLSFGIFKILKIKNKQRTITNENAQSSPPR